jgi:hypothetical protein
MSNKALKEHPPEPLSKSEWISVCDRLPETEANVLAVTEDYPVRMVVPAKYDGIDWCDIENTDRDGMTETLYQVTHWQLMPEPPKESE